MNWYADNYEGFVLLACMFIFEEVFPNLIRSLNADGYTVHEGKIQTLLPGLE